MFNAQQTAIDIKGTLANVLENHDQPRVLSKLVPNKAYQISQTAKALATMYYFLPGLPFIYQGQELGMKNFERQDIAEFNDVSSINNYHEALEVGYSKESALASINAKSRDNARTPMQWNASEFGGFSDTTPWLKMGNDRQGINVSDEQTDNSSVLHYYQKLGQIRHDEIWEKLAVSGAFTPLTSLPDTVIGYQRTLGQQVLTILINLSPNKARFGLLQPGKQLVTVGDIVINQHRVTMSGYSAIVLGIK